MLRARDILSIPYDFTWTWVDGAFRRERFLSDDHPEMNRPYSVYDSTIPFIFFI